MSEWSIGSSIAALRKEKGITQEALADVVGVTGQAVSKWESGGSPDTPLLPVIADYFGVSIDRLFGRKTQDYKELKKAVAESIGSLPSQEVRLQKVFEFCWVMGLAIAAVQNDDTEMSIDEVWKSGKYNGHSQLLLQKGATSLGIDESLRYFLIMPEPENGWSKRLYFKDEYTQLFSLLADTEVLKTLFFLYGRDKKPFTPHLLERKLNLSTEQAVDVLDKLESYKLIHLNEVELDDELYTAYEFNPNFSFIPFMTFAEELINRPNSFYNFCGCRETPYL